MTVAPIAVRGEGLVTSVGFTAAANCAAFRAKVTNPVETGYIDARGERIMVHRAASRDLGRGLDRLAAMAALAIQEALQSVARERWGEIPLLLCVAEASRPGRLEGLDAILMDRVGKKLSTSFASQSAIIPGGRVGIAIALAQTRLLLTQRGIGQVLVVATDSLLPWQTLSHFVRQDRLLTPANSDGFMPGEGGGALLLGWPVDDDDEVVCTGIGFGTEPAPIGSGEPLRADGIVEAIDGCLREAGIPMHELDFRVTDNSGEHYYFKESTLAIARTLKRQKEEFDIWHPAECIGDTGTVAGIAMMSLACAAIRRRYKDARHVLMHLANDDGERAAMIVTRGRVQ